MVCTACGIVGADARPNWTERPARASLTGRSGAVDAAGRWKAKL
jgi:hypothetical protein